MYTVEEQMHRVDAAVSELRKGKMVLITIPRAEVPHGAFVVIGSKLTSAQVNLMVTEGLGLVCVAITRQRAEHLELRAQAPTSRHSRADHVLQSVEATAGVSTGISAPDRARTIRVISADNTTPKDLVVPGHIFPVSAENGGVFARPEIPEAATDLARFAGYEPSVAYCKILDEEGEVMSAEKVEALAKTKDMACVSVDDIVRARLLRTKVIREESSGDVNTLHGAFEYRVYKSDVDSVRHIAFFKGDLSGTPLVRVHSQCLTGDVFGSHRCDCGDQLDEAIRLIAGEGKGVVVYLLQEGRGIGLANKLRAYSLQDKGQDTVEANESLGFDADLRDYSVAAQILSDLGIDQVRLLTNNPLKIEQLEASDLKVVERIPLELSPNPTTEDYLRAKKVKLGHLLTKV
jgi:3,4-dihydroxy 2-butanone 4-phosphate synthase/GTP cyclohydrolase II